MAQVKMLIALGFGSAIRSVQSCMMVMSQTIRFDI